MKLSLGLSPRDYSVSGGAVAYDTNAQAYFTANTTITSDADKNAINTFYLGLKSDGVYTKIKAMYLPLWSSASSNKWNLVNPVDSNAAYRLTFTTGWTHASSGVTPNGTSAYADSFLAPSTALTLNSAHLSFYSRTNTTGTFADIGSGNNSTSIGYLQLTIKWTDNKYYANINDNDFSDNTVANSLGFFLASRTSSTNVKTFKSGTTVTTKTTATSTFRTSLTTYLGARNLQNGGASNYSNRQCSFASIGDGLTDAEATNFYSRVNTLMTYFGINV